MTNGIIMQINWQLQQVKNCYNVMKYKKKLEKLRNRQGAWDKMPAAYQRACKRPGSQKK